MAQVICNDGTTDVSNGIVAPCTANGGVKSDSAQPLSDSELKEIGKQSECYGVSPLRVSCWSNGQKWTAIIGGTLVLYYILHKTGSLK